MKKAIHILTQVSPSRFLSLPLTHNHSLPSTLISFHTFSFLLSLISLSSSLSYLHLYDVINVDHVVFQDGRNGPHPCQLVLVLLEKVRDFLVEQLYPLYLLVPVDGDAVLGETKKHLALGGGELACGHGGKMMKKEEEVEGEERKNSKKERRRRRKKRERES